MNYNPNFQVGDKVFWLCDKEVHTIANIDCTKPPSISLSSGYVFTIDGKYYDYQMPTLFHVGALTFNEHGLVTSINWDYTPLRNKDTILKLGDRCFVRDSEEENWRLSLFLCESVTTSEYKYDTVDDMNWKYCIPYEGNEHLLSSS